MKGGAMKRITPVLAALALVLVAFMLVSCGSNELLKSESSAGLNGGFELTDGGYPINWAFGPNPEAMESYRVSVDTTRSVEGSNSLQVASTRGDQTKAFRSRRVPVESGRDYRIAFSVMNEGCSLRVNRTMTNAWGTTHMRSEIIAESSDATGEWAQFEEILTVAEGEAYVFLTFLVDGVGILRCDDVRVDCVAR